MTDRGRRNRTIWIVLFLVLAAILAIIWFGFQSTIGGLGDRLALNNLRRVDLYAQLKISPDQADHIIIEDGSAGWFVLASPRAAQDKSIGFFGTRAFDAVLGTEHIPVYCGSEGKVVWAIKDNDILASLAYCSQRRMDLSELRPIATPVTIIEDARPQADVIALHEEIATRPDLFGITIPQQFKPFDHSVTLTSPYTWKSWGNNASPYISWDDEIRAIVEQQFPQFKGRYVLSVSQDSAPELTTFVPNDAGDGFEPDQTGPTIQRDGKTYLLDGVDWIERMLVTFNCAAATCEALQNLDLTDAFDVQRDLDLLTRAVADPVPMTDRNPEPRMPTEAALKSTATVVGDVTEVTYRTKHAEQTL